MPREYLPLEGHLLDVTLVHVSIEFRVVPDVVSQADDSTFLRYLDELLSAENLPNRAVLLQVIKVDSRVPGGNDFVLLVGLVVVATVPLFTGEGLQVVCGEHDCFVEAIVRGQWGLVTVDCVDNGRIWHDALVFEACNVELLQVDL